jgi:ParB/RepB/Spo0J family partition protein
MESLVAQIEQAEGVMDRVRKQEEGRSELINLAEVVEEDRFASLRTEMRDIDELAAKIAERGQLVPILVWLHRGRYVLLSGHRRVAAMRSLGETRINAIVYDDHALCAKDALDIAIDDNIDRNNFSKVELAQLVSRMVGEGMTQRQIASRLRLSNGSVSDYFRLHSAPRDIRAAVDAGRLAIRAGLRLAVEPKPVREQILAGAEAGMLSLGDVERRLTAGSEPAAEPAPRTRARRGGAWSRPASLVKGLAWERNREGERELRVRLPVNPTTEQRAALRKLLLDQIRSL